MFCPKCGQENPEEAKFCGKCAAPLPVSPPSSEEESTSAKGEAVSQGLNIGIIIGTVLIPLLGIVMGLIYMADPHPAKKAAGRIWLWVGIGVFALSCLCSILYITVMAASGGGF